MDGVSGERENGDLTCAKWCIESPESIARTTITLNNGLTIYLTILTQRRMWETWEHALRGVMRQKVFETRRKYYALQEGFEILSVWNKLFAPCISINRIPKGLLYFRCWEIETDDSQAYLHTIEPLFSFIKGVIVAYFRFISMPAGFAAMLQVSSDKCMISL